ncbi:MAG: aminopeptidase [Bacteroidales bacterium]|nr:aminopeptidase [Bacteroidales bacterium]
MKKIFLSISALIIMVSFSLAQEDGYKFTVEKEIKTSPVRDQYRSGTCWSFAGLAFVEAEMIRLGKEVVDLAEMYAVKKCYEDKAEKAVRMHGEFNFGGGGALNDPMDVIKKHGIVPEEVYSGLQYGTEKHVHGEIDNLLVALVEAIIKNPNKELSTGWKAAIKGVVEAYLGEEPAHFTFKGKKYTPKTFSNEVVGINPDDYVLLTSFSHHPFYKPFILEIPDNWSWANMYNLPLDEFMAIFDASINKGYTVGWASDVSEKGFSWKNGIAIVPDEEIENLSGLEQSKWDDMSPSERQKLFYTFEKPIKEKVITQEIRQQAFDNYQTTDDHGMLISGIAKDQNGTKYYIVKNSWGEAGIYKGFFYASEAFVKYKTISIIVHKDVVPKELRTKLGF